MAFRTEVMWGIREAQYFFPFYPHSFSARVYGQQRQNYLFFFAVQCYHRFGRYPLTAVGYLKQLLI